MKKQKYEFGDKLFHCFDDDGVVLLEVYLYIRHSKEAAEGYIDVLTRGGMILEEQDMWVFFSEPKAALEEYISDKTAYIQQAEKLLKKQDKS
jgi:hypothetical protein